MGVGNENFHPYLIIEILINIYFYYFKFFY
jgi:hypothetical protein